METVEIVKIAVGAGVVQWFLVQFTDVIKNRKERINAYGIALPQLLELISDLFTYYSIIRDVDQKKVIKNNYKNYMVRRYVKL